MDPGRRHSVTSAITRSSGLRHHSPISRDLSPLEDVDPRCPQLEMADGSFLMWTVLAIARLHQIVTSNVASGASESRLEFRLRNTVNAIGVYFGDTNADGKEAWTSHDPHRTDYMVLRLKCLLLDTHEARGERTSDEVVYLHTILQTFHENTRTRLPYEPWDEFGSQGMLAAIAGKFMHDVGDEIITPIVEQLQKLPKVESAGLYAYMRAKGQLIESKVELTCTLIENYVRQQNDLTLNDSDIAGDIGPNFVDLIHEPLKCHVHEVFCKLLHDLNVDPGFVLDEEAYRTTCLLKLYIQRLACFFSYASPLLRNFFILEVDPMITALEGDELDDEFEEYEPNELVDILPGPPEVPIDEVSNAVPTHEDSHCAICLGADETMRKIIACGHELGEVCLATQLTTYHSNRYKCPLCRASLLNSGKCE